MTSPSIKRCSTPGASQRRTARWSARATICPTDRTAEAGYWKYPTTWPCWRSGEHTEESGAGGRQLGIRTYAAGRCGVRERDRLQPRIVHCAPSGGEAWAVTVGMLRSKVGARD